MGDAENNNRWPPRERERSGACGCSLISVGTRCLKGSIRIGGLCCAYG
jgi:hypothetical protein